MINNEELSLAYIEQMMGEKDDPKIMDVVINLLRLEDLSEYKEIIDKIVQYVYDFMHVSNYERLIYFSEPIKNLLKKPTSPLSIDEYYDFATLICYVLEDFEGALVEFDEYYDRIIKGKETEFYYNSLINYSITNIKLGHVKRAKEILEIVVKELKDKPDSKLWYMVNLTKIDIMLKEDDLEEVPKLLETVKRDKMIDFTIDNKVSLYVLYSKYYEKMGNFKAAIYWYDQTVQLLKEHKIEFEEKYVYKDFAKLLRQNGDFMRSARYFERFVDLTEEAIKKNRNLMKIRSELEVYIKQKDDEAYQLLRENKRIKRENTRDYLTGIYNKRYFNRYLENRFYNKDCVSMGLFVFDIDNFKEVNDRLGHAAGDFVIKEICDLIVSIIGDRYVFARTGGDEFMICFDNEDTMTATEICNKMIEEVKGHELNYEEQALKVSISGGYARCTEEHINTIKELIHEADMRLYKAKDSGKGRLVT